MARPMMGTRAILYRVGVLVVAAIAYFYIPGIREFFENGVTYLKRRNLDGLRQFILDYGVWAPICSIMLMTLQSLVPFVPGLVITIANAWIFGWAFGAIYSWVGALLGASLDFAIARWYGRPVVEKFITGKYLKMIDLYLRKHGIWVVFITRLTPIIPFKVVSYGVGLTTLSFCRFVIATAIGQAPAIILYSVIGQNLTRNISITILITSLLVVIGAILFHYREEIEKIIFSREE
ncbi:TVP38/TMEM64 family protein [Pelosinus sp. UFO1]|uniref:TVP38/TMEM64 family protein n=1 Tax=Pelosinus sp. UFO1 TaxID=484770 RepID=UPI0004D19299|nr:TVP38/TMEM64 family protein [Pelosinus sp. UFO1]AIF51955.1 SNARE associated protein [Pelosinus sp. UFO1]